MGKPTVDRAIARVRTDPDSRLAALLAAVFAFSLGFVIGLQIGGSEHTGDSERTRG